MAHKSKKTTPTSEGLPLVHPHAAGIDVGAEEHWVCVPADRDVQPIQKFRDFRKLTAPSEAILQVRSYGRAANGTDRLAPDAADRPCPIAPGSCPSRVYGTDRQRPGTGGAPARRACTAVGAQDHASRPARTRAWWAL